MVLYAGNSVYPEVRAMSRRDNPTGADNQQGRPAREPSTTTRTTPVKTEKRKRKDKPGYHWYLERQRWVRSIVDGKVHCCDCHRWLPLDAFCTVKDKPYTFCKACQRLHKAASRYGISLDEARRLYSATFCECCGADFVSQQSKHIHHIGSDVIGVLCLTCNHLIRDESPEHLRRIKACVAFIENRVKI
jgi:hypothetical protein